MVLTEGNKPIIITRTWNNYREKCNELGLRFNGAHWIDSVMKIRGLHIEKHKVIKCEDAEELPDWKQIEIEIELHQSRSK